MANIDFQILKLFKQKQNHELSTSEIVERLFPKEAEAYLEKINNPFNDKTLVQKGKDEKAQLHRRVLYYLNNLVYEGLISVKREGPKGEKIFTLLLDENSELIVGKGRKKLLITKPVSLSLPIEGYENENLVRKYDPQGWTDRLNSIYLDSSRFSDLNDFYMLISQCFPSINDVIGLVFFEKIMLRVSSEELKSFLKKLNSDCVDYGKFISVVVDFTNLEPDDSDKIIEMIMAYATIKPSNINIIFDVSYKELLSHHKIFESTINIFSQAKIKLYLKNSDLHEPPYLLGKAGPYTFEEQEWETYLEQFKEKTIGLVNSQSAIAIDFGNFFEKYNNITRFRQLILAVSKTLLYANSLQRRNSDELFRQLINLNGKYAMEFFSFGKNYIRIWNYGWKESTRDYAMMIDLLRSAKEDIEDFCLSEETIYKSCGIPVRFRISLAVAAKGFDEYMAEDKWKKIYIKDTEDLHSPSLTEMLKEKEQISSVFTGGNYVLFHRASGTPAKEMLRELSIIMNTYKITMFCYDFGEVMGTNMKLTNFLG